MAMDLMTPEGKAEAERLARQLPTGDRTTKHDEALSALDDPGPSWLAEDEDLEEETPEEFMARYDAAVARVVAANAAYALLKVQAKGAKEEIELALFALQRLRKDAPQTQRDEPRQLPIRHG